MGRKDLIRLAILILALGAGCMGLAQVAKYAFLTHELRGRVEDDSTHAPIPGAQVDFVILGNRGFLPPEILDWFATTKTDQLGEFRYVGVLRGEPDFHVSKVGYFPSRGRVESLDPLRIAMLRRPVSPVSPVSSVSPTRVSGNLRMEGTENPFRIDLERGVVLPSDPTWDVGVRWGSGPDSTIEIIAAPGREILFSILAHSASGYVTMPVNVCVAPTEGYVDSLTIPWNTADGVCFVRRKAGPRYGAFGVHPARWFAGPAHSSAWINSFDVVMNPAGGRVLCNDRTFGFQ